MQSFCCRLFVRLRVRGQPVEFPGDYGEEETHVPIPNTTVKLLSGDGTMALAMGE